MNDTTELPLLPMGKHTVTHHIARLRMALGKKGGKSRVVALSVAMTFGEDSTLDFTIDRRTYHVVLPESRLLRHLLFAFARTQRDIEISHKLQAAAAKKAARQHGADEEE